MPSTHLQALGRVAGDGRVKGGRTALVGHECSVFSDSCLCSYFSACKGRSCFMSGSPIEWPRLGLHVGTGLKHRGGAP